MRIFVPYTQLHEYTLMALQGYEYTPVQMENDESYADYFAKRWEEGETFINIEHDSSFAQGILEDIWDCPEPWCGFGYHQCNTGVAAQNLVAQGGAGLGVVKFSAAFIAATPDMFKPPFLPQKHWAHCDGWVNDGANAAGIPPHQHWPDVVNCRPCATCGSVFSPYVKYELVRSGE